MYGGCKATKICSLHGFADASVKAHCAIIYFVYELGGSFVPLKMQTIPRLELMSGRILARLMETVLEEEVEVQEVILRLDSKTVLY